MLIPEKNISVGYRQAPYSAKNMKYVSNCHSVIYSSAFLVDGSLMSQHIVLGFTYSLHRPDGVEKLQPSICQVLQHLGFSVQGYTV